MSATRRAACLLVSLSLVACQSASHVPSSVVPMPARDPRPIFAEAALPRVGTTAPGFDVPHLGGGRLSLDALQGRPVLLALWSTGCVRSREAVAVIDSLHRRYRARGVTTVLLADDADSALVRRVLRQHGLEVADAPTVSGALAESTVVVGLTNGRLRAMFDRASDASGDPAVEAYRVEFVAPGFLLVDATGVIRRRAAITLHAGAFAASLDSLLLRADDGGGP